MANDTKNYILNTYPELINEYKQDYCTVCLHQNSNNGECPEPKLPVTIHGQLCTYFKDKQPKRPIVDRNNYIKSEELISIDDIAIEDIIKNKLSNLETPELVQTINDIRELIHTFSPFKNEPVDCVLWVDANKVVANDYNPNKVAPPEMKLLERSVDADGFTQPIVSWPQSGHYEVVDGFHRNRVGKESKAVNERLQGYLPISVIKPDRSSKDNRIASTIRHNRARGKHQIEAMSDIVIELKRRNWSNDRIARELGMDADEILRLTQITGLAEMFTDQEFANAWDIGIIDDDNLEGELITDSNMEVITNGTDRIYHTWDKWECYRARFFETRPPNKMTDDEAKEAYRELLSNIPRFKSILAKIIVEWPYSCEHNLTNTSLNRIAWLGQATLAYDMNIPACYRVGYHLLTEDQQQQADLAALEYLNVWLIANKKEPIALDGARSHLDVELY